MTIIYAVYHKKITGPVILTMIESVILDQIQGLTDFIFVSGHCKDYICVTDY